MATTILDMHRTGTKHIVRHMQKICRTVVRHIQVHLYCQIHIQSSNNTSLLVRHSFLVASLRIPAGENDRRGCCASGSGRGRGPLRSQCDQWHQEMREDVPEEGPISVTLRDPAAVLSETHSTIIQYIPAYLNTLS